MAGIIKHVFQTAQPNRTDVDISASRWNDYHVFSGGNSGSIAVRDLSDLTYGSNWIQSVATGQVLASAGVGTLPAWSSAPSVTTLTASTALIVGTTPSSTGQIRLGNLTSIRFRNAADSADIEAVRVDASNKVSIDFGANGVVFGAAAAVGLTSLAIGSTASGAGAIRLSNAAGVNSVRVRNAANSDDIILAGVSAGSNDVYVGNAGGVTVVYLGDTNIPVRPFSNGTQALGGSSFRWDVGYFNTVAHGATPAATGAIRLTHGTQMNGRNNANTTDRALFDWGSTTADWLTVGDSGAAGTQMGHETLAIAGITSSFPALIRRLQFVRLMLADGSGVSGAATGSLPAAGAGQDGIVGYDTTLNALVYYVGGNRYKVIGVAF